jgi:3-methyladenine DNA glycosylase AlkD
MASRLLVALRRDTNGAVVSDMESRGLHYRRNYGVSLHTVRSEARKLAINHGFAKYLWKQPVRELKLATATVADPCEVSLAEVRFWLDGVENIELAEVLASYLFARTAIVRQLAEAYIDSNNPLWVYVALLSLIKGYPTDMTAHQAIELTQRVKTFTTYIERAVAMLLSRAAISSDNDKMLISEYVDNLANSACYLNQRIANEVMI